MAGSAALGWKDDHARKEEKDMQPLDTIRQPNTPNKKWKENNNLPTKRTN